jgi:HEAT repeat protein
LVRTKNPAQQKLFLEIIGILAQRNFKAFKELINTSDADKLAKLIILLGYIKGKESDAILMEKIHHPSVSVRQAAIKILLARDAQTISKLFPLIDDPDESIRQTVFFGIGQQKSNLAESLLLNYIEQKAFKHSSQDHVLSCLKALGGCGSEHSHGLLKKILLDQGWNSTFGFGRPVFRKGAAAALLIMDSVEAKNILNKAAQSSFSIVRDALQKAIEEKENAR